MCIRDRNNATLGTVLRTNSQGIWGGSYDAGQVNIDGKVTLASLRNQGGIVINTSTTENVEKTWTFDPTGKLSAPGAITATGDVTGANLNTAGAVSATGNVSGNYILGNGSKLTGIDATSIQNGNSNVRVSANSNITMGVAGSANVVVVKTNSVSVAGDVVATGNLTGTLTTATQNAITRVGTLTSLSVSGTVNAGGNISIGTDGMYYIGTPSYAWNTVYTNNIAPSINSTVLTVNPGSNATSFAVNGSSANALWVDGSTNTVLVGSGSVTTGAKFAVNSTDSMLIPVGTSAQRPSTPTAGMMRWNTTLNVLEMWKDNLWESIGATNFTVVQNEDFTGDGVSTSFTLSKAQLSNQPQTTNSCIVTINGVLQAPSTAYSVTDYTLTFNEAPLTTDVIHVREITTTTSVNALMFGDTKVEATTGRVDVTGGDLYVPGNIHTASLYADNGDLAENYLADQAYAPGTVLTFGGSAEVTLSTTDADRRVAGVVTTDPSYVMNSVLAGENVVTMALMGRIPCRVTGLVARGDMMVSNGDGTARAEDDPKVGSILGKALADFDGVTGVIEIAIGRL